MSKTTTKRTTATRGKTTVIQPRAGKKKGGGKKGGGKKCCKLTVTKQLRNKLGQFIGKTTKKTVTAKRIVAKTKLGLPTKAKIAPLPAPVKPAKTKRPAAANVGVGLGFHFSFLSALTEHYGHQIQVFLQSLVQSTERYMKATASVPFVAQPNESVTTPAKAWCVEDLRQKYGLWSTDDIARQFGAFFIKNGSAVPLAEIFDFVRKQTHASRSNHRKPVLRMDTIRNNWAGVFMVYCPPTGASEDEPSIRPMVWFSPYGVAELLVRWSKLQKTTTAASLL
jgi:hypothetical protein